MRATMKRYAVKRCAFWLVLLSALPSSLSLSPAQAAGADANAPGGPAGPLTRPAATRAKVTTGATAATGTTAATGAAEATGARIAELIARLGSDAVRDREEAQRALVQIGKPALAALLEAARDKDPERATRARGALEEIGAGLPPMGELRFLAAQPDRADDEVASYWRPNGLAISDPQEVLRLQRLGASRMDVGDATQAIFHLWFAIRQCDDQSFIRAQMLDANGDPLDGVIGCSVRPAKDKGQDGWVAVGLTPGRKGQCPARMGILLEYAAGPWGTLGLVSGQNIGGVTGWASIKIGDGGTDAQGTTTLDYARELGKSEGVQYHAAALLKDKKTVPMGNRHWVLGDVEIGKFLCNAPLKDVEYFSIRSRPTKTVVFRDVSLQPGTLTDPQAEEVATKTPAQPTTQPASTQSANSSPSRPRT
jgi:hypothetical protein